MGKGGSKRERIRQNQTDIEWGEEGNEEDDGSFSFVRERKHALMPRLLSLSLERVCSMCVVRVINFIPILDDADGYLGWKMIPDSERAYNLSVAFSLSPSSIFSPSYIIYFFLTSLQSSHLVCTTVYQSFSPSFFTQPVIFFFIILSSRNGSSWTIFLRHSITSFHCIFSLFTDTNFLSRNQARKIGGERTWATPDFSVTEIFPPPENSNRTELRHGLPFLSRSLRIKYTRGRRSNISLSVSELVEYLPHKPFFLLCLYVCDWRREREEVSHFLSTEQEKTWRWKERKTDGVK